jgi:hypothetical protein
VTRLGDEEQWCFVSPTTLTVSKMRILKKHIFFNYVSTHYSGPAGCPQEAKVLLQNTDVLKRGEKKS